MLTHTPVWSAVAFSFACKTVSESVGEGYRGGLPRSRAFNFDLASSSDTSPMILHKKLQLSLIAVEILCAQQINGTSSIPRSPDHGQAH